MSGDDRHDDRCYSGRSLVWKKGPKAYVPGHLDSSGLVAIYVEKSAYDKAISELTRIIRMASGKSFARNAKDGARKILRELGEIE